MSEQTGEQDLAGFDYQVALYYDGENLLVRSTEAVDQEVMHDMLSTALKALEQQMAGEFAECNLARH